jgi:hypothetical protein
MNRYNARDLLNMTEEQLWALPEEWHIVNFPEGDLITHTRATILSTYLWEPLRDYPDAPIHRHYHIADTRFTSKSMLVLINRVVWGIHAYSNEMIDHEWLALRAIQTVNKFYNVFTIRCSAWVSTLSLFDILEIVNDPQIKHAKANIEPTQHGIEKVLYPAIAQVLMDESKLRGNPITEGLRSGTLKMDQALQTFGARGFPTDINSDIFPEAITAGYIEGIWDLASSMAESRAGSKALLYNKELLRITEYFNRKTQLIAENVQRLHYKTPEYSGDCGADYIEFPLLEGAAKTLKGKYYLKADGGMDWLRGNEKFPEEQKTIKIRSVLACVHPDPAGVCATCYGRLSFSVPRDTNIGHVSAVITGDKITSSVLSTKHTDATSVVDRYQPGATEVKYLRYGMQEETLYLRRELHNKKMRLVVKRDEVHSLADVLMLKDLSAYPFGNASHLTKIAIQIDTDQGTTTDVLNVSLYNRKSSFSLELLEHIQKVRWTHDGRDNVVIELDGFDVRKPLLVLPYKHVNMYEVMKRIQSFLHSGSEGEDNKLSGDKTRYTGKTYLKNYSNDPVEALSIFVVMMNEKLSLNIVHCEVLVYAMMVRSAVNRDYRLPKPGLSGVFEKYNKIMLNRSLSVAMAFEKQHHPLNNPGSFLYTDRNDHPYDTIVMGGKMS